MFGDCPPGPGDSSSVSSTSSGGTADPGPAGPVGPSTSPAGPSSTYKTVFPGYGATPPKSNGPIGDDNDIAVVTSLLVSASVLVSITGRSTATRRQLTARDRATVLNVSVVAIVRLLMNYHGGGRRRTLGGFLRRFRVYPLDRRTSSGTARLVRACALDRNLRVPSTFVTTATLTLGVPLLDGGRHSCHFVSGLFLLPCP